MKTFITIGILMMSCFVMALADMPYKCQFWIDKEVSAMQSATYDPSVGSFIVDVGASNLSEGGHSFSFRLLEDDNRWSGVVTRFFAVPNMDGLSHVPKNYRVWTGNKIIANGNVPHDWQSFTLSLDCELDNNIPFNSVSERTFRYLPGEGSVIMTANGEVLCAFQIQSECGDWGHPIYTEIPHSVSSKSKAETITFPGDIKLSKCGNNNFRSFRFHNEDRPYIFLKASQNCSIDLYKIEENQENNLKLLWTSKLLKDQSVKYSDSGWKNTDILAIVYDMPINTNNSDSIINFRVMFEDNKLPMPEILFDKDSWEVSIHCADPRATIHYTLNGDIPTDRDSVYKAPIKLDRFTRVKAIAMLDGIGNSDVAEKLISGNDLVIPMPQLQFVEDSKMDKFILMNSLEGVKTYYVFGNHDIEDGAYRTEFDGHPFSIPDGTLLKARSEKENLTSSDILTLTVYHNDYVTEAPLKGLINGQNNKDLSLIVPEGNAKYRIISGKHEFGVDDKIKVEEWFHYEKDSWISIEGNMTVQAYAESDGKARSKVTSIYTDWVPAAEPTFEYDNFKLKLKTSTPGGMIYYYFDNQTDKDAVEYKESVASDGIDVSNATCVYAYVEAEGYSRSKVLEFYPNSLDLQQPGVTFDNEQGYIDIIHEDEGATIVVNAEPEPEEPIEVISGNHIRILPRYDSKITAYAKKQGFNNSKEVVINPIEKPVIEVEYNDYGNKVSIKNISDKDGEIRFTTDGSKPTRASTKYAGEFLSEACTLRAVLFVDGWIPAEADSVKVTDQVEIPKLDIINGFGKLSTPTPEATIYYSINIDINDNSRKKYDENSDGIDLKDVDKLCAYAEADGYRRSKILTWYKDGCVLDKPTLSYANGYVIANHIDATVSIIFSDGNGNQIQPDEKDPFRVKVPYNSIVKAYAYKSGFLNSEIATIESTVAPKIRPELFTVSIEAMSGQTVRYTTDGTLPDESSTVYAKSFNVTDTCDVRAVAFAGSEFIPAEAEMVHIDYKKADMPFASKYDGHYLTLSAAEGSTIKYIIGNEDSRLPDDGIQLNGNYLDVEGLNVIKAVAKTSDADYSDVFTYEVKYYANESDVYSAEPGHIKDAFNWCDDKSSIESLSVHGSINNNSTSDNADYNALMALPQLSHIDLSDVTDEIVPDNALVSDKLVSVIMPKSLKTIGNSLFGENNTTLCAVVLPGDGFVPATLLDGINNPNLLVYAKSKNYLSSVLDSKGGKEVNVITLGNTNSSYVADNITLCHAHPFYAPIAFHAKNISFTRSFTKETQIEGLGSGWETLVVPFDVKSISIGNKTLKPFGVTDINSSECPFWLFKGGNTDWEKALFIEANTPYLIAFPNHPWYEDEYIVNGDVVFSSQNLEVTKTPARNEMAVGFGADRYIFGNYTLVDKKGLVFALNQEEYFYNNHTFKPGGIFVQGLRDIPPFECYVISHSSARAIPVFDSSDVESLIGENGVKIWSEGQDIYIRSAIGMKVKIFDTVGQLLRIVDVKAGETVCAENFTPGIYIVGNSKLYVK